jgi:hypothetical protein
VRLSPTPNDAFANGNKMAAACEAEAEYGCRI